MKFFKRKKKIMRTLILSVSSRLFVDTEKQKYIFFITYKMYFTRTRLIYKIDIKLSSRKVFVVTGIYEGEHLLRE